MRILCLGVSHKTADVSVREKLVFDAPAATRAMAELRRRWPEGEFLILSTCNRTEVYIVRPLHGHPRPQEISDFLGEFHGLHHSVYAALTYCHSDQQAVEHLFAVACGLDSLVPGEDQIVGQIKEAYKISRAAGTAVGVLHGLVQDALHVAKHVRSETAVAQGKVSVASVAMDCVLRTFQSLRDKTVLNVGAGKMNALMLRHLAARGAAKLLVANRSAAKAAKLARQCGGKAVAFAKLVRHMDEADVIVTSTAAPRPILTAAMVRTAQKQRKYRPLLIIDLAVPRDVEPAAGKVRGVRLCNIDSLDEIVQATLATRLGDQAQARATIARHVQETMTGLNVRSVGPTLEALYKKLARIADQELQAAMKKLQSHDDAQADEALLRQVLHRTIRQIFHSPAHHLRQSAGTDAARAHVATVRKLFNLGE